ncbi:MAG: hypothetical protein ACHQO8_12730, partial [Vicinamibacterales bacterium]
MGGRAIVDWRATSPSELMPLLAAEVSRWRTTLDWDASATWALVERARRLGTLPGFIVRGPDGDLRGWTYYLLHHGSLQIGAVSALADEDTEALIDAVLASPESAVADDVTLFAFASAPGVEAHLGRRGFLVERYRYLRRPIDADRTPATNVTDLVGGEPAG